MKLALVPCPLRTGVLLLSVVLLAAAALPARADMHGATNVMTKQEQAAMTPAQALQRLKDGHARFLAGKSLDRDYGAQVTVTGGGQFPFASVLTCIDPRTAPEIFFDQGVGDIFAPRIAGNFVDPEILGSLEFSTRLAGSKLVVVVGHTECGAIKGACDGARLGNLTSTLAELQPAVTAVGGFEGERHSKNAAFVAAVTHKNVEPTLQEIREKSPILAEMEQKGEVDIVGAICDVRTGEITWL